MSDEYGEHFTDDEGVEFAFSQLFDVGDDPLGIDEATSELFNIDEDISELFDTRSASEPRAKARAKPEDDSGREAAENEDIQLAEGAAWRRHAAAELSSMAERLRSSADGDGKLDLADAMAAMSSRIGELEDEAAALEVERAEASGGEALFL